MISLGGKSLFINAPLDEAIENILKKVYKKKKVDTSILKIILKELLHLCTNQVHFIFNDETYIQCDGVAMDSSLSPLLVNSCRYYRKRFY